MRFLKRFFGIKGEPKAVTINVFGNDYVVDLSPEAQQKRNDDYEILKQNSWKEINEVSLVGDDGVTYYETQFVNPYEEELVNFYGRMKFSENKEYCVVFVGAFFGEKGMVALVNTTTQTLLYKINVNSPHKCNVSNNGIVACNDWNSHDSKSTSFFIFDVNGSVIFSQRMNENIGDTCLVSKDGNLAAFDTFKTYNIKIVDIENKKIIHNFSKGNTKKIDIDFEDKKIIFEYFDDTRKIKNIN
ncbi:hypothetical protein [Flavobacterium sp.]|uniref:hypothetical protein n=1 Tax=Flavobacterium sp. TaxID=239 RepID=UPI0037510A33